jgi:Kef-type K+ transport system membrane component KefB
MKNALVYVVILAICGGVIWLTLQEGQKLEPGKTIERRPIAAATAGTEASESNSGILMHLRENLRGPLAVLLTQIILIVFVSRLLGRVAQYLGQPQVIGEMIGGIMLGPSLLGQISPRLMEFFFPATSMDTLSLFSQVGVILFMFLVGTEVDIQHLLQKAHTTLLVSNAGILFPFFLGTTLSLFIYTRMAPPDVSFMAFALFIGVSMSITAFPVLARIIEERGLTKTSLGNMSIGCAAVGDVTAWCVLAAVLAIVRADGLGSTAVTLFFVLVFAGVMILLVKPLFRQLVPSEQSSRTQYNSWAAVILAFALAAGLTTEVIGVHALFGAFLAGTIIPPGALRSFCKERFEGVAAGLLLPLFFVFTGLRTQINLLNSASMWTIAAAVIGAAVLGKLGGSMLAARWSGMDWRDSFALGALMNTRGLMELIVLNIGYDLGILSSEIFAILVLMAIVTTLMTAPLLSLVKVGRTASSVSP